MSQADTRSTKVLFREWRSGDAEAGQIMAQRFADWYYAIATSRLGEERGRQPCEAACASFGEGIVSITESRQLVPWAHELIQKELEGSGSRATDGDEPNAYTGNQNPKALLVKARGSLKSEVELLEASYSGSKPAEQIDKLSEPLGGGPLGILKARYRVKQWLRDNASIPFEVAPDDPVLDRAPLPLYESGRMSNPQEEASFEQWMISDIDLCKDIAEFAHFAIALRGGLPTQSAADAAPAKSKNTSANAPSGDDTDLEVAGGGRGGGAMLAGGMAVVVGGGFVVLLVLAALVGGYFFLM